MRFIGNSEAKTDVKGRVFLPSVFRKILAASGDERLVMRMDPFQPCLTLYPESVWNETLDSLRNRLNRWNSRHQMIFRQFVNDAEIMELDSNGRFLIPRRYLQKAGISQKVRFIGMDDTIEIWGCENVDSAFMAPEEFGSALELTMREELKPLPSPPMGEGAPA